MDYIKYGIRNAVRRKRSTAIIFLTVVAVSLALVVCQLCAGMCDMVIKRSENPYSDYYRLLTDRTNDVVDLSYTSKDKMLSGTWENLQDIHKLVKNITDYTAELSVQAAADLQPVTREHFTHNTQFTLYGISECMDICEFARGELSLADGRYLTKDDRANADDVCMISDELANINGISAGEYIFIQMADGEYRAFLVVGIYSDNIWRNESSIYYSYSLQENYIYIPLSVCEEMRYAKCFNYQIKLDNDALIDDVEEYVNKYSMADGFPATFIRVSDIYNSDNQGIHTLKNAANGIRYFFVGIALALLVIFIVSDVGSRKKELGVYIAIGAGRHCVILMLATEILLVSAVGTAAAAGISACFAPKAANFLLGSVMADSSAEALKNTSSDTVMSLMRESEILELSLDAGFVLDSILYALSAILLVSAVSVSAAAFAAAKTKTICLLSASEDNV